MQARRIFHLSIQLSRQMLLAVGTKPLDCLESSNSRVLDRIELSP
jgi:hypothetical protein